MIAFALNAIRVCGNSVCVLYYTQHPASSHLMANGFFDIPSVTNRIQYVWRHLHPQQQRALAREQIKLQEKKKFGAINEGIITIRV